MSHITSVNRLTYVMDASPATSVTLFVNKAQYAGRYSTIDDAQLAALISDIDGKYKIVNFGEYNWDTVDSAVNIQITVAIDYAVLNF